jgi:uncharacterized protein (TIGR02145 family)
MEMKMLFFGFAIFANLQVNAQNYLINFAGTGASKTVSEVKVENLTEGTTLILHKSEILRLIGSFGVSSLDNISYSIRIYPNPMTKNNAVLQIYPPDAGNAFITIYDLSGKIEAQTQSFLGNYPQEYRLSGLKNGFHLINVTGGTYHFSSELICSGDAGGSARIDRLSGYNPNDESGSAINSKRDETIINMVYNYGDRLKFTGISESYSTVKIDTPIEDETVTFNFIPCSDKDNNNYSIVEIGSQVWMAENLRATKYNNGNDIDYPGSNVNDWNNNTSGAYAWYNNDKVTNKNIYGALYNWYAVNSGNICPTGWHVPISEEWITLRDYLGGLVVAGEKIKETGGSHWTPINHHNTNESGFTALPGGISTAQNFIELRHTGYFWSSATKHNQTGSYGWFVSSLSDALTESDSQYLNEGLSVRCIIGQSSISLPVVLTESIDSIGANIAIVNGLINSDGGDTISDFGVCWDISKSPTILNNKTAENSGTNSFATTISGLLPATTYFVRAYATNSRGTAYGDVLKFTTLPVTPTLSTTTVLGITRTTAISGGEIISDGGAPVTAIGICWSTSENPSITGTHSSDPLTDGSYESNIAGLLPNTAYYVQAYATNSAGTAYGNEVSFTTAPLTIATLTTTPASSISSRTALSVGRVTDDGGENITSRGICWSLIANPTITDNKTSNGTGTGSFTGNITGLLPGTMYHVRAYASNSIGTAYGSDLIFTTLAEIPALTTSPVTGITLTSVISGGNIISNGGAVITASGICWGTSPGPSISGSFTTNGKASGSYTSSLTNLNPNTTYYIRAYATNSVGTAYGNEISFLTRPILIATLTTNAISSVTSASALSGGNITNNGGGTINFRGVCWSTTALPTVANDTSEDGIGTGSYTSNITGLQPGTTYHVRAYATNEAGTGYGNDLTFTTSAVLPVLTTTTVSGINRTSATSGGNIITNGGATITYSGVCWSTAHNPSISGSHSTDGTPNGSYISNISGLTPGSLYYVRAYATNVAGTAYGNEVSFTTNPIILPTLTTTAVTSVTSASASSGGNITDDGGGSITVRGVCWSTSASPTILDNISTNGTGSGVFTSNITGLLPVTTYHVRAYATNIKGTSYGNEMIFTTLPVIPSLTTTAASGITRTTALSGGNISSNGGAPVTASGVCWSTSHGPTTAGSYTTDGTASGSYVSSLSGLTPGTLYYVRAYATSSVGTAYGNEVSFTTNPILLPTLTTVAVTSVTSTTASSGGNITDDGGGTITIRGVCWATTASPTTGNSKTTNGTGTGFFTNNITGLQPGTTYHVRAYATNSAGTAYGNDLIFYTVAIVPTISTTAATGITRKSATSGGNITSNGGSTVTVSGVCWGTSHNPSISGSYTTDGNASGAYSSSITGLTPGTLYYVRAYATNGVGTSYGNEVSFTTNPITNPTVTTTALSSVASTTATSGGNVTDDGGSSVTVRGVCWATTLNPTTGDNTTTDGTGTGSFTSNLTGLIPETTYYIRAYATNGHGTAYGSVLSFTTDPILGTGVTFSVSSDGSLLLHSVGDKRIILKSVGSDNYIKYSSDNGSSYNTGVKVTGIFTSDSKARILGNGIIVLFCGGKIYYSSNNLATINPCNVLNKDGSVYTLHTPVNPSYPGGYFNFMGGFVENGGVAVMGNYTNNAQGASQINLYYSLDGITWKVFYTFGQNPKYTDNGTAMGGTGGTLLGDPGNPLIARHIHSVNLGDDGNFYACTGDADGEMHFMKCVYNNVSDSWSVNDLLSGSSRIWQRMRALGVYERNGYLYWGSDGSGTFIYNSVQYNCLGIYKCAVSDINDPSKHILLKSLQDACYSFVNADHIVFAGMQSFGYVYISYDYGETWTVYKKPAWMTGSVQGVWYNVLYKYLVTATGVFINSTQF